MPVDLYVGGAEHAVLHLMYARFWHKVLFDLGHVSTKEPFMKLRHQGIILGEDSRKMSKSRGNVVNPDDVVKQYGADAMRLFEMFMGPLEEMKPWSTRGVEGVFRFLNRVWRLYVDDEGRLDPAVQARAGDAETLSGSIHATVKKVGEDIEGLRFNTAICPDDDLRERGHEERIAAAAVPGAVRPAACAVCPASCRGALGETGTYGKSWPTNRGRSMIRPSFRRSTVEIVLQVNGKVRGQDGGCRGYERQGSGDPRPAG